MTLPHALAAQSGFAQPGVAQSGVNLPAGIDRIDRTGRGLAAGTSAWNKVFEAQQMAALDRFHSVGNAVAAAPARGRLSGQPALQDRRAHAVPVPARMPGPAMKAMPAGGAPRPGVAVLSAGPAPARAAVPAPMQQALQAATSAGIPREVPGAAAPMRQTGRGGEPAAILEALTGRQWPRKNIHVAVTAEGMYVWLRDSAPALDPDGVGRLAAGLRAVFRQSGNPLAGVSLNGIRII